MSDLSQGTQIFIIYILNMEVVCGCFYSDRTKKNHQQKHFNTLVETPSRQLEEARATSAIDSDAI